MMSKNEIVILMNTDHNKLLSEYMFDERQGNTQLQKASLLSLLYHNPMAMNIMMVHVVNHYIGKHSINVLNNKKGIIIKYF